MSAPGSFDAAMQRIETLVQRFETLPDLALRSEVQGLVDALLQVHGAVLGRLVAALRAADDGGRALGTLAADAAVTHVLELHDLGLGVEALRPCGSSSELLQILP